MPTDLTRISASISLETKLRLEDYALTHGVKKSHVIETALIRHLSALEEIPEDILIPPVLELSRKSGERVLERIENSPAPTAAMKALFSD